LLSGAYSDTIFFKIENVCFFKEGEDHMKKILYFSGLIFLSSTAFGMQDDPVFHHLQHALSSSEMRCCVCEQPINDISPDAIRECTSLPEIKAYLDSLNLENCDACAVMFHSNCLMQIQEDRNFHLNLAQCAHQELFKWRKLWVIKRGLQENILPLAMCTSAFYRLHNTYVIADSMDFFRRGPSVLTCIIGGVGVVIAGGCSLAFSLELFDRMLGRRGYSSKEIILVAALLMSYHVINAIFR
jgi:hypothetical protein